MSVALILGGADTLHDDLRQVREQNIEYDGVIACNQAGVEWPYGLDAWVTVHPLFFLKGNNRSWATNRIRRGYTPPLRGYWTHQVRHEPMPDNINITSWKLSGMKRFGSSGLFAVKVALIDLDYQSVVLCGIPMTSTPHFDREQNWKQAKVFRAEWDNLTKDTAARIRSMSGWTKDKYGAPTECLKS